MSKQKIITLTLSILFVSIQMSFAWEKYYDFHGYAEIYKMIKVSDGYILTGFK